jgi:hypothetical protein
LDTSVPHSARVWNYWLGGQDNYPPDRMVGDQVMAMFPDITRLARADRAFLGRAVRYLAGAAGLRQFLDVGTGLPTADNTHQVAQAVAADSRIVYVDNDPLVLAHARALLTSTPQGACDYIDADLRDPAAILAQAARTLDFSQPVAVILMAVVHLVGDEDDPYGIIGQLVSALPPGSYLAIPHIASDINVAAVSEAGSRVSQFIQQKQTYRTHDQVLRFFDGLDLVEPGLAKVQEWRPDSEMQAKTPAALWGGVGRKP